MSTSLVRRGRRSAPAALLLVGAILAACSSAAAPSTSAPASTPPASSAPASDVPVATDPPATAPAVDIDTLIASGAANDGKPVTVKGFFITDGTNHQFCAIVLESYPPQCGGTAIVINGALPAAAMALLERPSEPGFAKVAWGSVELRGTYRAAADGGKPSLDVTEMAVTGPG